MNFSKKNHEFKKNNKNFVSKNLKRLLLLVLVATSLACNTDDDMPSQDISGLGFITTDNGFNFTLTYPDGKEVTEKSSSVFGLFSNQLLNSDYSIGVFGANEKIRFDFKYSIPKTIRWDEAIDGLHNLRSQRLTLQQTGNLGQLQTEFWLDSNGDNEEFDPFTNATGTVRTKLDVSVNNESIGIVLEVDAFIVNDEGQRVKVEGILWKKDTSIIR